MVSQGDVLKINFDPQLGHEQSGYRPTVVVSNRMYQGWISRAHILQKLIPGFLHITDSILANSRTIFC